MFNLEEPKSKKRGRDSEEPLEQRDARSPKRCQSAAKNQALSRHRPSSFWDTLSRVRLSRSALREFDRRNIRDTSQSCPAPAPVVKYPTGADRQRLKRLARRGGPNLSYLRGFACKPLPLARMSQSTTSGSRKRSVPSSSSGQSDNTLSSKTTPYSGNFEQKLIDNGIYPSLYEHPDGRSENPANLDDIRRRITTIRPSLSPSEFTSEDFAAFQLENKRASAETTAMRKILPTIAGNEAGRHYSDGDLPFFNLEPFDEGLSAPKPDVYYGAPPSQIHRRVRADLGKRIIPSTVTNRPAAPNFFVEGKSSQGRADIAERQACHDGAAGARAMYELQNYGADEPVYDNNAYSLSSTYHAGTGTLQIYATHPTAPTVPGGKPEYHMTQVDSFAITGNINRFREGASAYRNSRDVAKEYCDSFIDKANERARDLPMTSPSTSFTNSRSTALPPFISRLDTSEDDLALDRAATVKRQRPASTSTPGRNDLVSARHHRSGSSTTTMTSRTDVTNPRDVGRRSTAPQCSSGPPASHPGNRRDAPPMERPLESSSHSQRAKRSGERHLPRSAVEVASEPIRHEGKRGLSIQHRGESLFVPDSRWISCEKNGRQVLYCARLQVYTVHHL